MSYKHLLAEFNLSCSRIRDRLQYPYEANGQLTAGYIYRELDNAKDQDTAMCHVTAESQINEAKREMPGTPL